ncbi:MAG: DUF4390 domain-containing protein [Methylosarcina sp.]
MHVLKNGKLLLFLGIWGWLSTVSASANPRSVTVNSAEMHPQGSTYLLSAEIGYRLSAKAIEALRNGISLFWDIRIRIQHQRKYLWNTTIAEKELRYRIQYHALLNMYRVRNENSGEVYNFSTLPAALDLMSSIRDIPIVSRAKLDPKNRYIAKLKVSFDRESLPLPLRPIAYLNPQWYLSSDWYVWSLTK